MSDALQPIKWITHWTSSSSLSKNWTVCHLHISQCSNTNVMQDDVKHVKEVPIASADNKKVLWKYSVWYFPLVRSKIPASLFISYMGFDFLVCNSYFFNPSTNPSSFLVSLLLYSLPSCLLGGSVVEWSAWWTQAQKGRVQIAAATLSGNSLRQTVHTHRAFVQQAVKLVAALLRVVRVTYHVSQKKWAP